MEDWQAEIAKAEARGYKKGVTVGYSNGFRDGGKVKENEAFELGCGVGYHSHSHDLLDVLEALKDEEMTASRIIDELEPIEKIRQQTNLYIYDTKYRNKD